VMQKHLSHLAWETVCWCADTPGHLIHMDGDRILGPYGK
jgi:type II restriction enzyme